MFKLKISKWIIRTISILSAAICIAVPNINITARAQTSGDFSVCSIIPDNQVDKKQTYFDLRMKPGDEQEIQIVISNSRAEELCAEISLNNASTGRNGLIVYTEPAERNELMKVSLTDVATLQEQMVLVPANGYETITIHIKMPEEPLDGVILGGVAITANDGDEDNMQKAQGVSLKNTITYVTAIKLTQNDDESEPDFDLVTITPSLINYRTAVVATVQNKAARIVKDMEVNAQVFKKGSDSALHELALSDAEMAPLSNGDFVIDWKNQSLDKGTYRLKMTADYFGEKWEWDKEFTIAGDSDILNKEAVGLEKDNTWLYWLIGAVVLVLVLIWFIAYGLGKRKKKTGNEEQDANL